MTFREEAKAIVDAISAEVPFEFEARYDRAVDAVEKHLRAKVNAEEEKKEQECDECHASIPIWETELVNNAHEEHCSLHPCNVVDFRRED